MFLNLFLGFLLLATIFGPMAYLTAGSRARKRRLYGQRRGNKPF